MAAQLAKILGVKMLSPGPNQMDTRADRTHSFKRNNQAKGRTSTTTPKKDSDQLCKEGCCFTCEKQGHLANKCPDKAKSKAPVKARAVEAEESDEDDDHKSETSTEESTAWGAFIKTGQSLPEADKIKVVQMAAEQEQGQGDPEWDF